MINHCLLPSLFPVWLLGEQIKPISLLILWLRLNLILDTTCQWRYIKLPLERSFSEKKRDWLFIYNFLLWASHLLQIFFGRGVTWERLIFNLRSCFRFCFTKNNSNSLSSLKQTVRNPEVVSGHSYKASYRDCFLPWQGKPPLQHKVPVLWLDWWIREMRPWAAIELRIIYPMPPPETLSWTLKKKSYGNMAL